MSKMNPRPEAQPRSYDSLSKTQQRAVSGILQYLDQFVATALFSTAESETTVRLDLNRPSNVVLIDGERGSGKTETLLTLLGFWTAAFDPKDESLQTIRSSVDKAVTRETKPAIGIPVPVLDMQPLPSGTSLLMQLATRLYRLVERQAPPAHAKTKTPPFVDSADTGQALHAAWQRLVRAAASAESEGKASRNLTPEDLADELEWRERESGNLCEAWREFASQVVKQDFRKRGYQGTPDGKPCLIVSIDDADMNPSRCVELLELVRSLWHPRVVFLLTGHTELFHELLQHKFEKDGLSSERAERLARLYFDKVVPKHQRFTVWADAQSALKLLSSSAGVWGSVMQLVPELKQSMPRRWRAVRDLEAQLRIYGAPGPTSARVLFHRALEEADLAPAVVRHMERHVLPKSAEDDDEEKDQTRFVLDDGDLVLQLRLTKQLVGLRDALSLTLSKRGQAQVALKAGRVVTADSANRAPIPLPQEVEAALYLAAISADDIGEGGRLNRELTPASYSFAESHVKTGKLDLCFAWPTPEWVKTVDFLLFRHRWEQLLEEFRPRLAAAETDRMGAEREAAVERLVYAFLSTLCTLAKDGEKSTLNAQNTATDGPDWNQLSERLSKIAKDTSHFRQRVFADWALTGATMFIWSPYGLPPVAQGEFARCWLRWLWRSTSSDHEYRTLFDRVKQERNNILRRTAELFMGAHGNELQWLFDAVLATRHSLLGDAFRDLDEQRIARWKERLVSKPEEQRLIAQEAIDDILSNVQLRDGSHLANIFDQDTFHYDEHLSFHLLDQLAQISIALPTESSVVLQAHLSLERYLQNHADMGIWPARELMWQVGSQTGSLRMLISSLQQYANKSDANHSGDALREIVRVFATLLNRSQPDLSKAAMLARTYQLPSVDAKDRYVVIQPGLHPDWQLQITKIERDTWWREGWSNAGIELVRMLTSLHDLIVDQSDIELERTDIAGSFDNHLCFTEQLAVKVEHSGYIFMAAEPRWRTVSELKMLVGNYGVIASQLLEYLDKQQARTATNVYCLALVICANRALFRNPNWDLLAPIFKSQEWGTRKIGEDRFAIRTARDYLARVRSRHYRGRRWQAVEAWARYGVPLYAAPESGMTEEEASEWLSLFADAIEQDREQLRAVRRYRAQLALQKADKPATSDAVEALLEQIDASVPPTHAWLRLIEQRPIPPANPTGGTSPAPSTGTPPDTSSTAEPVQT